MDIAADMVDAAMDIAVDMVDAAMDIAVDMVDAAMDIAVDMVDAAMDIAADATPAKRVTTDIVMATVVVIAMGIATGAALRAQIATGRIAGAM
ncbi:hypothetical protein [Hyphobacterium sp.]|uniref:hypothetical protein n=1 Tax=Hyphobacterium sp. TaxID=2004662 RepID=UPI003B51A28D